MDAPPFLLRILLRLYPRDFRDRYGPEIWELVRTRLERCREGGPMALLRFWSGTVLDLVRGGLAERGVAARAARRGGGGGRNHRERMAEMIWNGVSDAARRLARSPGFTLAAVAIVALGIATNVAVFSAVDAFLLRPPPWLEPERVVRIYQDSDDGEPNSTSFPAYRDMAALESVFGAVGASTPATLTWEAEEGPRPLAAEFITASYLRVLGLEPFMGRWFEPAHDQVGAGFYAVVSYRSWQGKLGGDPGILGRTLRLNGQGVTVVGVGPREFGGTMEPLATDVFLSISTVEVGGAYRVTNLDRRQDHWYQVQARLAPGVTVPRARAAMDGLARSLAEEFPELNRGRDITVFASGEIRLHPDVDGDLLPAAGLLLTVVGMVLLLACSNLANLLLARGMARAGEVAVRRALGASRFQVIGLFLLEALLLAGAGGVVGVLLAGWGLSLVPHLPIPLPWDGELALALDRRVLLFALGLVLLTGLLFGLAPALRSARGDVAGGLRADSRTTSPGRGAVLLRTTLVAVQVAVSLALLVASGLLVRSFRNLTTADPGVAVKGVALLRTDLQAGGASQVEGALHLEELIATLGALPGVEAIGAGTRLPVESRGGSTTTVVEDYVPPSGTGAVELLFAVVDPGYFETLEIPLIAGRGFTAADRTGSPRVAILSRAAAERFWPGQDPIGRRIRPQSAPEAWTEVVGVVEDMKVQSMGETPPPLLYRPLGQAWVGPVTFLARSSGDAGALAGAMRTVFQRKSPTLPVDYLGTLEDHLGGALAAPRTAAFLLAFLALGALFLASLGIYAVVAFAVSRRTSEMAIRLALGAAGGRVMGMVVREVAGAVGLGLVAGVAVALPLGGLLEGSLYRVGGVDLAAYGAGAALLVTVAGVASYLPARKAARTDPVRALRAER